MMERPSMLIPNELHQTTNRNKPTAMTIAAVAAANNKSTVQLLQNGCVCCSLADEFFTSIGQYIIVRYYFCDYDYFLGLHRGGSGGVENSFAIQNK
jgi:hypothetical protein